VKLALALAAALALAPPFASKAAERAPADIVADIYRIAAGPKGDYQTSGIEDPQVRKTFTHRLLLAMDAMNRRSKKENEPILDFDPITASQDPSVADLKIEPESGDLAHPVVDASFDQGAAERAVVRYIFVREGAVWKLDDIAGGNGGNKWSLREIITPKSLKESIAPK
jgi:Protein of unknown function (DUF3828)